MAYNEFGIYEPRDPDLDQMRLALTKQPSLASQIPGSNVKAPKPNRPLDQAELNIKSVAASLNPLMMMKTMQDAVKTAVINPLLMPASIAVEAAQGTPAREITGSRFYQEPTTPVGQAFERDLGKVMEAAKVPHMFPTAPRPAGMRPALTPNDVRVMGAEATRVARGIKDIPSDFANAQSGFTRMDPVTQQPTYGATLQGVAEGIGDLAQSRRDAGMSLVPGIPDVLTPETSMYAVRPKGTRLVTPTRTSADPNFTYQRDPAGSVLKREFARPYATDIDPVELQGIAESTQAKMPNAQATEQAFTNYSNQRMEEMFPDAPDSFQAQEAFRAKYSTPESQAQLQLQLLDDFLQTPEGQATGMARPAELEQRHLAAMKWLTGPFSNYIERNLGTEGDPLVKLASQGFTMRPADELRAEQVNRIGIAMGQREKGGYPQEGSFEKLIESKQSELESARTELRELETRRTELATAARAQGLEDPARLPAYAELTNPIRAKAAARDKLQRELDNLYTGAAYEDISDAAVRINPAEKVRESMDYPQKQFYPTLMQTPADTKVYAASATSMGDTGIQDIAKTFYDDVMSGKIPLDKVEKTTVENFVRRKSEERVKTEADKKAKEAQYIATAEDNLRAVLQFEVPNDMTFGNAGVILLDQNTPESIAVARVSEDTAILDHCVGEGGSASSDAINPFTGKRKRYEPIIDIVTGQRNPNSSRTGTSYTRGLANGNQLASIRSLETGRPVATLQFDTSHLGANGQQMYRIGYASGYSNGDIDPAYSASIRDYLNSRADNIASSGENLADHAGVYDTKSPDDMRRLARKSGLITGNINDALDNLPRFVLADDVVKAAQELATPAPARGAVATPEPAVMTAAEAGAMTGDLTIAMSNAVDTLRADYGDRAANVLDSVIRDRMREFLDGIRNEQLPLALGLLQRALRQDEMLFVASNSNLNQQVGDGLSEFLADLDGIIDHNERQLQGRNAAPDNFNFANLFEPEPNHPANLPAPVPAQDVGFNFRSMLDRTANDLAQNAGADISRTVWDAARELQDVIDPQQDPVAFAMALRDVANTQESMSAELALYDLADQLETAYSRQVAAELLEMGRNPDGTLNLPDLMDTANALSIGELDHPAYRDIPPGPVRAEAMRGVLDNFNNMVVAAQREQQPTPAQLALAQVPAAQPANAVTDADVALYERFNDIVYQAIENDGFDPGGYTNQDLADLVRNDEVGGGLDDLTPTQRDRLASLVSEYGYDGNIYANAEGAMQPAPAPAPVPAQAPAPMAPRSAIPAEVRNMTLGQLGARMDLDAVQQVHRLSDQLTDVNDREDLPRIVDLIRSHLMGEWENFNPMQRELLARRVDERYENAPPTPVAMPAPNTPEAAQLREDAMQIGDTLDEAYFVEAEQEGVGAAPMIRNYIRNLDVNSLTDILGMAGDSFDITPQLVNAVRQELEQYLARYEGRAPEGYQAGGSVKKKEVPEVKTPWLFSVPTYSETVAYEMYPGQKGQDDQRDAARHMLAAGTLARKYGPGAAEFLGKAHEVATSPIQAAKTLFGGKMPRDYDMDTHNNTIGMQLGQRAKTQAELEALVQIEAERASRTQIPGRAFINKAHGGIVKQNPSVEQMRFEIMMRGK